MGTKIEVGAVLLVLIAAVAGGLYVYLYPERVGLQSHAFEPLTLHGSVEVAGAGAHWLPSSSDAHVCIPQPAYASVEGDELVLSSGAESLGTATLPQAGTPDGDLCVFHFDLPLNSKYDTYHIEVQSLGGFDYSYDQLVTTGSLTYVIGG